MKFKEIIKRTIKEWQEHGLIKSFSALGNSYNRYRANKLHKKIDNDPYDLRDVDFRQKVEIYFQIKQFKHQKLVNFLIVLLSGLLVYVTWLLVKVTLLLAKITAEIQ